MRPSLLTGQGILYQHVTGPLILEQTSPALGSDPVYTPLPLLWCGLRFFVGHLAAWAYTFDSTRPPVLSPFCTCRWRYNSTVSKMA
jgi:hypothetical protein